jgi:dephospho-CoA kinase
VVDRKKVAEHAFADPAERKWLEGVLWPQVGRRMFAWREEQLLRDPQPRALVVEVPLLFEAGMEKAFDGTIAVVAPEDVRTERAGWRGHAALDERGARQLPQEEKAQRADFAIVNDGSEAELEEKLTEVLGILSP